MTDDPRSYRDQMRACRLCEHELSRAPKPVLQASGSARILVAGQAPGNLANLTGTPFRDPSGVRLRQWMGVTQAEFYDASRVAIVAMGFCFPGNDNRGGDLPAMKRCAQTWRTDLLEHLPDLKMSILLGGYAQEWHPGKRAARSLTQTVRNWKDYTSDHLFTNPRPSWRNTRWLKRNPWFETDVLPELRRAVPDALDCWHVCWRFSCSPVARILSRKGLC